MENNTNGAFRSSLKRNNQKIRDDRATAIIDVTQMKYKRKIEDLDMDIKNMKRERENMLDLSPTDADSLVLASDFDEDAYVQKDIDLSIKIRNTTIKLEVAQARYLELFVKEEEV